MISRRIFAAVASLCILIAPAQAQKSKATLSTELNANWPDNSVGAITPAILRSTVLDIINSYVDWITCTGTGGVVYWAAGTPTCLLAGLNGQTLVLSSGVPAWGNFTQSLSAGAGITITGTITPIIAITNVVTPLTIGDANDIPQLTYNTQGEITATLAISPLVAITNITTVLSKTVAGNIGPSTANASGLNGAQVGSILCTPIRTALLTGTTATYTPPTCSGLNPTWLEVDVQGGGAGGGASGTASQGNGISGGASVFGALTASGGTTPTAGNTVGGVGGTCSGSLGTQQNFPGSDGSSVGFLSATPVAAGNGGVSFYGGYGKGSAGNGNASAGGAAPLNSGGGGGGGGIGTTAGAVAGAGGGAGCHIRTVIVSPLAATYTYSVGGTAGGGAAGTNGNNGGQGGAGLIDILAHWQ